MKPFLIVKAGSTFHRLSRKFGDFEHWTARNMGLSDDEWECVDAQKTDNFPDPTEYAGVVITGSHSMVSEHEEWMEKTSEWLRSAIKGETPILGICFGHQLLADALGGTAGDHPEGREVGTVEIDLTDEGKKDPLFEKVAPSFAAHVTHTQSALKLPAKAIVLAANEHEPHQAFRIGDHVWGVQFHPEFDDDATRFYVDKQLDELAAQGSDPDVIYESVQPTPEATSLLPRFAELCRKEK